jgi:hypothetical protein
VETLTTQTLADACRIFMELAYPGGIDTIPACRRSYFDMGADRPVEDYLSSDTGVCQDLDQHKGCLRGYEFRLGSAEYPHIKLRVQMLDFHQRDVWVFSVNTHDRFFQATKYLSPSEAEAWKVLIERNRALKYRIEQSLERAGFMTPKMILQHDLALPVEPS